VRDLLTMSTGHEEAKFTTNAPWVDLPRILCRTRAPISQHAGSHMLAAIVGKVTGQTVLDYLKLRLFGAAWH
jgi:CubicO group peptidase (beta-lactamase class C family)